MKIKGFLKDVGGASRVTRARLAAFERAPEKPVTIDPIAETAREWHPGLLDLVVTDIRPASRTAVTVRFQREDGKKLPVFYAGQYIALEFDVDGKIISRPYSISSAPFEARGENPFVEITVRKSKGDGFIADFVNTELRIGSKVKGSMGCGQFYYEPLRDAKNVMALAGGTGITPFVSMAKEIAHGTLDMDLTILYGSVSSDDIILKEELEKIVSGQSGSGQIGSGKGDSGQSDSEQIGSGRVHIVHVISGDEPDWTGERGFLSADLIRKYMKGDTSCFICGPQAMYSFLRSELEKLDIPKRRVRFEVFGSAKDVTVFAGFPQEVKDKTFELTVVRGIHEDIIPAKATESLVMALERAGIRIETSCRSGECGLCRTKVISGNVFISPEGDGRRAADKDFGYVHACSAYPVSDLKIKIPIL